MNESLAKVFRESIASGLKRRTLTSCSRWTQACVFMGKPFPGPFNYKHHPWTRDMCDSEAGHNVGQKSAQMGFTVVAMCRTFFKIDVERQNCLYLLPTKTPDATDFSATRFDPMLELSPHLEKLFSDVKNVATKRAGSSTLYIRGANSRSGLKSIPVAFLVFDEYDEMPEENIPLALERMSGQLQKQVWAISTPTVPNWGINKLFLASTQEHFFFKCPCCGQQTELIFPDCLKICGNSALDPDVNLSHLICKECKGVLEHKAKSEFLSTGHWEALGHKDYQQRGFYINQMYSPTVTPVELAKSYHLSLSDQSAEQEFYNSKLGDAHIVDGARINDVVLNEAIRNYRKTDNQPNDNGIVTMGVDIGKWLHFEIARWYPKHFGNDINALSECNVICEGKVADFSELDKLMHEWRPRQVVVDANPERRKAYEFAMRFYPHVKLCLYGKGLNDKSMQLGSKGVNDPQSVYIQVDRTSWLDMALGRFYRKSITLPVDVSHEYREHLKSPVRVYEKDRDGNPVGKYINTSADHFAHARCYNEIALPLAVSIAHGQDIAKFL